MSTAGSPSGAGGARPGAGALGRLAISNAARAQRRQGHVASGRAAAQVKRSTPVIVWDATISTARTVFKYGWVPLVIYMGVKSSSRDNIGVADLFKPLG